MLRFCLLICLWFGVCPEYFCWSGSFLFGGQPSWSFVVGVSVTSAMLIPRVQCINTADVTETPTGTQHAPYPKYQHSRRHRNSYRHTTRTVSKVSTQPTSQKHLPAHNTHRIQGINTADVTETPTGTQHAPYPRYQHSRRHRNTYHE
jgi:hypothetical protein